MNTTTKSTTTNHSTQRFHSALTAGILALLTCTTLVPKTKNHRANYIDVRPPATNQTTNQIDPGYNWFY